MVTGGVSGRGQLWLSLMMVDSDSGSWWWSLEAAPADASVWWFMMVDVVAVCGRFLGWLMVVVAGDGSARFRVVVPDGCSYLWPLVVIIIGMLVVIGSWSFPGSGRW